MTEPADSGAPGQERVFGEPWQAQAFALTLQLHAAGHFTWQEWSRYLAEAIRAGGAPDESDESDEDSYYRHWLSALERLLMDKHLLSAAEHRKRQQAWASAARHTPHGKPISLAAGDHPE